MTIYIGSDHAGFELKERIKIFLRELEHEIEDLGAHEYNQDDDYPDFVIPVARSVADNGGARGIIFGGSGQGEAIAANRVAGARAAVYYGGSLEIVKLSREHNDANILSLGARFLSEEKAKEAIKLWLDTPFSGEERHARRIKKLEQ